MLLDIQGWVRDLNEVHLDHLGGSWGHWRRGLRSPELSLRQLRRFEGRIEAHADALVLAGESAREELVAALGGEADEGARAAADALLLGALGDGAARLAAALLAAEKPSRQDALLHAIAMRPNAALLERLDAAGPGAPAVVQVARRLLRAALGRPTFAASEPSLAELRAAPEPTPAASAWIATASERRERLERDECARSLASPQPALRESVLRAAFARGETWALALARELAPRDLVCARWVAALGSAQDFELLRSVAGRRELGPERFLAFAGLGDARALPLLIEAFASPNPADASAAGWAFRVLTGKDVHSLERVPVVEPSQALPDAFDALFLDEVFLPDAELARAWLGKEGARLEPGLRWRGGVSIDTAPLAALDALDPLGLAERSWRRRVASGAGAIPGSVFPFVPAT